MRSRSGKERYTQRKIDRVARGLCIGPGEEHPNDSIGKSLRCTVCAKQRRDRELYLSGLREFNRGRCLNCDSLTVPGCARCQLCITSANVLGVCNISHCEEFRMVGSVYCQKHLEASRKHGAVRRELLKDALNFGKCKVCARDITHSELANRCTTCYFKSVSSTHSGTTKDWKSYAELFAQQGGLCAITGVELTLAYNCSLDHKIPKIRGGLNDISNYQFVLDRVNCVKQALTDVEFFSLCQFIAQRNKCEPILPPFVCEPRPTVVPRRKASGVE